MIAKGDAVLIDIRDSAELANTGQAGGKCGPNANPHQDASLSRDHPLRIFPRIAGPAAEKPVVALLQRP